MRLADEFPDSTRSSRLPRSLRKANCGYILVLRMIAQRSFRGAFAEKEKPRIAWNDSGFRLLCEEGESNPHGS
jgi:hypothetical protein